LQAEGVGSGDRLPGMNRTQHTNNNSRKLNGKLPQLFIGPENAYPAAEGAFCRQY